MCHLQDIDNIEDRFRQAIFDTSVRLSNECFMAAHAMIASIFSLVFSYIYLFRESFKTTTDETTRTIYHYALAGVIPAFLFIFVPIWFFFRSERLWVLWRQLYDADVVREQGLTFLIHRSGLIRSTEREEDYCGSIYQSITSSLWGSYDLWLHQYVTSKWLQSLFDLVYYGMWAAGPIFVANNYLKVGQLLVLLDVIGIFSSALISLMATAASVFTSGSMVIEVAQLLNYQTRGAKRLGSEHITDDGADNEWRTPETESHGAAVCIREVNFGFHGQEPLLSGLNLYKRPASGDASVTSADGITDATKLERSGTTIQAGRLIGVRTMGTADPLSARTLMRLLSGELLPDGGVAMTLPPLNVEMVSGLTQNDDLMRSSLHRNLTYAVGVDPSRQVSDPQLWELCKRVGMSSELLGGDVYKKGWASGMIRPNVHRYASDLGKILLVRALLQRPDVLIVHHLSDQWRRDDQKALLADLIRGFIDGTLDDCLGGSKHRTQKRTVFWSASDAGFEDALSPALQPGDLLLTLHSVNVATIGPAEEEPGIGK